ncbi:MAG: carboxypeptidase regulatory-like domain-containing protein [Planctomycetes bacterium]|nr:carboxypeptidase regulatory-like domain-containing protein [Planctomycetota bacterium]
MRGLVLDDSQRPLGGVQVHLLESAANDPLSVPLILQQRLPASPMASTQSAADGTFAIGLPRVQDRIYELYLLSPAHATVRIAELRLLADQWHDLGAITLVPGTTLRGRVTVEGLSTPVPNAVVVVEPGTAFDDVHRRSLPEGHHGLVATTDATGRYELPHAPARGAVRISAVAAGFARVVHKDIELGAEVVELDFALAPGWTLRGVVRDAAGAPVSQARIEAWPNLAASPALVATSDHAGSFEVQGLSAGPHRVRAIARGFQSYEVTDVAAGRSDLVLVLPRRGRVAVRATTADGTVLRTYQLHVRRWFDDRGGQLGLVPDVPEQSVRLDGFTDRSVLDGLPNGRFVCEVAADGFARSLSPPFEVAGDPGPQAQAIDVVVHRGATLRGRVLRDDGAPLAGAEVVTGTDGADPDSPFWKLVVGSVPSRVTQAKATTALDGSFALPHLMDGAYQLEVRHPEVCRTIVRGIELVAEQDLTVPPVVAQRGAIVTGRATIGGRLAGQIKVVLTEAPGSVPGPTTRLETVTDANGAFRLPRRVPPGSYELRAAVVGSAEPDAQFLRQLLQLQRSSTTVTVPSGADLVEQDIDIPDAR